jgi:hypothetical protein
MKPPLESAGVRTRRDRQECVVPLTHPPPSVIYAHTERERETDKGGLQSE